MVHYISCSLIAFWHAFPIIPYHQCITSNFEHHLLQVGNWTEGQLQLDVDEVQGFSSPNGSVTPANKVEAKCTHDDCLCTTTEVKDLNFELKYARLTLLGYFPIHNHGPNGDVCSQIRLKEGFEPLMAFKYAVQRVNNDPNLLPNVTLGYMVFDTCSDDEYAALAFDAFDKNLKFFSKSPQVPVMTYVHAFIGGFENDVSKALNKVSDTGQRLVQVSQVLYVTQGPESNINNVYLPFSQFCMTEQNDR